MTWTQKVATLAEKDPASVAPFAQMTEEEIVAHPFFQMLSSLWTNHTAAAKKTATKKVMTEEEKVAYQQTKMTETYDALSAKGSSALQKSITEKYSFLGEDKLKLLKTKALVIGLKEIDDALSKAGKTAPKATKTLADGRKVANHNNYARRDDELVKNADGSVKKVMVKFKNGSEEECGIIPTPGDDKMTKGWTFAELDGCKSVERAQKGHSQVFIKKMWFNSNPTHEEGRCPCAAKLNKKIQLHCYEEDGDTYSKKTFKSIPVFACNNPIAANGVCKAHNKTKDNEVWDETMLKGWTPVMTEL